MHSQYPCRYRLTQQHQDERGGEGIAVNVLGPEAIVEMGVTVGKLVKHLAATTERRRGEKSLPATEHDPNEDVPGTDESDDPGLELVEIDEDE